MLLTDRQRDISPHGRGGLSLGHGYQMSVFPSASPLWSASGADAIICVEGPIPRLNDAVWPVTSARACWSLSISSSILRAIASRLGFVRASLRNDQPVICLSGYAEVAAPISTTFSTGSLRMRGNHLIAYCADWCRFGPLLDFRVAIRGKASCGRFDCLCG